jgi:hypothetical protein
MRRLAATFMFTVLGCATHSFTARFTPSGAAAGPAHLANCEFKVLTAPPPSFVEIGTIDVEPTGYTMQTQDLGEFKRVIQPRVCEAGGDAAIAIVNSGGQYIKATVIVLPKTDAAPVSN